MRAIDQANRILDWQENLSKDEVPPEWMWPFDEELKAWFEEVDRKRSEKFGGGSSSGDIDGPSMSNQLAEEMRARNA